MIIDQEVRSRYRKAAKYLEKDLPKVVDVPAIRHAFRRIGDIGGADFKRMFKHYEIEVVADDDPESLSFAHLHIEDGAEGWAPVELRLSTDILSSFETGNDLTKTRSGLKVHMLGALALAAMVNYRHVRSGQDYDATAVDRANKYVLDMYGFHSDYGNSATERGTYGY